MKRRFLYRFVSGCEAQEIIELYATRLTAKAVGEKVGRNPGTVTDTLRKHGVAIRRRATSAEDIAEMTCLYNSGLSLTEIAITLRRSRSNVGKYLGQTGMVLRDKGETT